MSQVVFFEPVRLYLDIFLPSSSWIDETKETIFFVPFPVSWEPSADPRVRVVPAPACGLRMGWEGRECCSSRAGVKGEEDKGGSRRRSAQMGRLGGLTAKLGPVPSARTLSARLSPRTSASRRSSGPTRWASRPPHSSSGRTRSSRPTRAAM